MEEESGKFGFNAQHLRVTDDEKVIRVKVRSGKVEKTQHNYLDNNRTGDFGGHDQVLLDRFLILSFED